MAPGVGSTWPEMLQVLQQSSSCCSSAVTCRSWWPFFFFFLNYELQGKHSSVTRASELGAVPAITHIRPMTCVFCGMRLTPSWYIFSQQLSMACGILAVTGDGISVILGRRARTIFCFSDGDLWGTHLACCLSPGNKLHLLSTDFKQGPVQNPASLWDWIHCPSLFPWGWFVLRLYWTLGNSLTPICISVPLTPV